MASKADLLKELGLDECYALESVKEMAAELRGGVNKKIVAESKKIAKIFKVAIEVAIGEALKMFTPKERGLKVNNQISIKACGDMAQLEDLRNYANADLRISPTKEMKTLSDKLAEIDEWVHQKNTAIATKYRELTREIRLYGANPKLLEKLTKLAGIKLTPPKI